MSDAWQFLTSHQGEVWRRTVEHLEISGVSLVLAMLLALPVALWLGHTGRGGALAINASNVGRALPSLALIALLLPLPFFGLRTYGPLQLAVVGALILLSIPPILTNAYVGIRGVDRDLVEAARGMGMSEGQVLRGVELPLAAPVIMSGIGTAAVQVVATATIGAIISGGGLGRLIVDGFATQDVAQLLVGAFAVAVLAVLTEVGFSALTRALTPRPLRAGLRGTVAEEHGTTTPAEPAQPVGTTS